MKNDKTIKAYHFGQYYCLLQKERRLPKIEVDWLIKELRNGCFHNGPVICPRLVIMTQGRLYWPEAIFEVIKTHILNLLKILLMAGVCPISLVVL